LIKKQLKTPWGFVSPGLCGSSALLSVLQSIDTTPHQVCKGNLKENGVRVLFLHRRACAFSSVGKKYPRRNTATGAL
jgi:hypothetical protein